MSAETERRGDGSLEASRDAAGRVVHGVYRLVKGCLLHADSNQAIAQLVDSLVQATCEYTDLTKGTTVSILFASNNVFVDRQMLRTSRETYQLAVELGQMIEPFGITELTLSRPLERSEAQELGRVIALAQRDKSQAKAEKLTQFETIRARRVVAFAGQKLTPVQRAARTFAASILIVQSFYRELREGASELPHGVKRVAQRLVTAADEDSRLLLAIAASPTSDADRPAMAVSSAIIALAMARQLVTDRSALLALVSAAILYDVGRSRLAKSSMSSVERNLTEAEMEKLPASTVASLTALGKLHPGSLARSVFAYEALALRGGASKVYGGRRPPSVLARVLHAARLFVEARATHGPIGGGAGGSMDDAVQALLGQARDATERTYAKLLMGALGLFPAGTLVELTTGEIAVVTATPKLPVDFSRPPVRILYDKDANLLEEPLDVDLARATAPGSPPRLIRRTVDADEQQMRQMRAYVVGLSTAAARTPKREEPVARPVTTPVRTVAPRRPNSDPSLAKATLAPRPRTSRNSSTSLPAIPRAEVLPIVQSAPPEESFDGLAEPEHLAVGPISSPISSGLASKQVLSAEGRPPPTSRARRDPRSEEDDDSSELLVAPPPGRAPSPSARSSPTAAPSPPSTAGPTSTTAPPPRSAVAPSPPAPPSDRDRPRSVPPPRRVSVQAIPAVGARPTAAPIAAARVAPNQTNASTRAMSWDQFGEVLHQDAEAERNASSLPPPPAVENTDALLAAYVDDSPSRGGGRSHGGIRAFPADAGVARNSAGLRWAGERDSRSSDSRSRDPRSSSGGDSSQGSRPSAGSWAGGPPSRGTHGSSGGGDSPRSRSLSGRGRTNTQDWTVGRSSSVGSGGPASSASAPTPPPPPPEPAPGAAVPGGPPSRKAKAGTSAWGGRDDRKK